MKNIIKTYNLTVKFSKFILNIKIYEEFVEFLSKETFHFNHLTIQKKKNSIILNTPLHLT